METDPLDRPILSHIHGRLIVLEEDVDVAKAVRAMHSQKADSDILDKVVMKGENSDQILLRSIASSPVI